MNRVTEILETHHAACDELLVAAESAADAADWAKCGAALSRFKANLEAHFQAEESVLFPAFEETSGMRNGPTGMMRLEHAQMRETTRRIEQAAAERDSDAFAGNVETLVVLIGQHNMKEQHILYPMCDRSLGERGEALTAALRAGLDAASCAAGA
jgi:iron-sulfur cluster repair protein YtfE (RIC family)